MEILMVSYSLLMRAAIPIYDDVVFSRAEELAMKRAANKSWHRPPQIVPNYGTVKKNIHPRSNISRVLLHDNNSQQMLLDAKIGHIEGEREKSVHLFDLHKKTFLVQQSLKQHQLRDSGIQHLSFLPNSVANGYCQLYGNSLGLKMEIIDKPSDEKKKERAEKATERTSRHQLMKFQDKENVQSMVREPSAGRQSQTKTPMLVVENSAGPLQSLRYTPGTPLLPKLGSAIKSEHVASSTRVTQSAAPTDSNRPSSRAFLTHDYPLRRGHTFTTARYSAKKRGYGNEPRSDPRFVLLHRSLIPNDRDLGGFLSLSPSGAAVLEKYGCLLSSN